MTTTSIHLLIARSLLNLVQTLPVVRKVALACYGLSKATTGVQWILLQTEQGRSFYMAIQRVTKLPIGSMRQLFGGYLSTSKGCLSGVSFRALRSKMDSLAAFWRRMDLRIASYLRGILLSMHLAAKMLLLLV